MIKKFFSILILIGLAGAMVVVGVMVWQSCHPKTPAAQLRAPEVEYYLVIRLTGQRVYSDKILLCNPNEPEGRRIYEMDSYWELSGDKFLFRDHSLTIDEKYFGIVEVKTK